MDKRCFIIGRDSVPEHISLGEGEQLHMTLLVPEGTSCKLSLQVDLDAPGAALDIAGAWKCSGSENVEVKVLVRHNAPRCTSVQLFKGVTGGTAHASFDGLVYVAPGADGTDARQENHSLLLSDAATVESRPQLEIYADDVKCSHGATTGYLNPEELFYMRSRGIPETEARQMQVDAFLEPVIARMK